jgi:hypothetical protein
MLELLLLLPYDIDHLWHDNSEVDGMMGQNWLDQRQESLAKLTINKDSVPRKAVFTFPLPHKLKYDVQVAVPHGCCIIN